MVKLVYISNEFDSISFEYHHELISVGSAEGNDLVLPDESIRPHHCNILLRDDHLVVMSENVGPEVVLDSAAQGQRYGLGEQFMIGELLFEVQHSVNTTVAIPKGALEVPVQSKPDPTGKAFKCDHCQDYFFATELTLIGLQGARKHALCPKCSRPISLVSPEQNQPARPHGVFGHLAHWKNKFVAFLRSPPP